MIYAYENIELDNIKLNIKYIFKIFLVILKNSVFLFLIKKYISHTFLYNNISINSFAYLIIDFQ